MSIIFDYAPVKMILTKEYKEVGQFAIDMCAIVGGVFIIFGLMNSFFVRTIENCKSN